MKRGILYVVFGEQYDKLAAHTIAYSRQFTDLPICILTNVVRRNAKWRGIPDIHFKEFALANNVNRDVKTKMNLHSLFEETLYLDCDSVIQKPGIERVFEFMGKKDLLLNLFLVWNKGDKILRLYKRTMKVANAVLPLRVYNGAFICWRNTLVIQQFFSEWNRLWSLTGKGREMPPLACTINKLKIPVAKVGIRDGYFCPDVPNPNCIVQHNYNSYKDKDWHDVFHVPHIKESKPFDGNPKDWNWVDF